MTPGRVYCEQAYAQGKMLDHSSWFGRLSRGCTPSDIDCTFDNQGSCILVELSSKTHLWKDVSVGQRRLYEGLVKGTRNIGVVAHHSVPQSRQIDSRIDIDSFSVMFSNGGSIAYVSCDHGRANDKWISIVEKWFQNNGPAAVLRELKEEYARRN